MHYDVPLNNRQTQLQGVLCDLFKEFRADGHAYVEYTLQADDGIRTPDVIWCSVDWFQTHKDESLASRAPEICAEILSPSNTMAEMEHKRDLYLSKGCQLFLLVDQKGFITFFEPDGQVEKASLLPDVPRQIHPPN